MPFRFMEGKQVPGTDADMPGRWDGKRHSEYGQNICQKSVFGKEG